MIFLATTYFIWCVNNVTKWQGGHANTNSRAVDDSKHQFWIVYECINKMSENTVIIIQLYWYICSKFLNLKQITTKLVIQKVLYCITIAAAWQESCYTEGYINVCSCLSIWPHHAGKTLSYLRAVILGPPAYHLYLCHTIVPHKPWQLARQWVCLFPGNSNILMHHVFAYWGA